MSLRVFIAVTHLLGAGHLTRAAAIARAFARTGHEVTLVSGGTRAPLVSTENVRLVQLPPVRTKGADFANLLDAAGAPVAPDYLTERRRLVLAALDAAAPDVVVTELFPFGRRALADEFMALIEAARRRTPAPLLIASVRDILAASSKPERIAESHRRVSEFYSAVLVHGDPSLVPLELSWPVDDEIRALIRYTGYVDEGSPAPIAAQETRHEVLVSGGSSAASLPLYRAALGAAQLMTERPWRLLVGAGVEKADFERLRRSAPAHAIVERARPDFRALLGAAAVSASQAGYNTAVDLLRAKTPAVLVPFEAGQETEQRLRARCLAEQGLACVLPEQKLSPATLAEALHAALRQPRAPRLDVQLDGVDTTVAIVEALAQERRTGSLELNPSPALQGRHDWSAVDNLLSRATNEGRTVAFWWRDDDAIGHTPAVDRLLALARRFGVPVALAAIPGQLEASLMQRVAAEPEAHILVHGLRHMNHAPPGEQKAEFGPHRPPNILAAEAHEALQIAKVAVGTRLLPVFVPPWNRVAPALTAELSGLGYRGISRFGDRKAREAAAGLLEINTHLDPVDWRGSRSLLSPATLIDRTARAIRDRLDGTADPDEPIGLLTHHRMHDERLWQFCEALLDALSRWRPVQFSSTRVLFD